MNKHTARPVDLNSDSSGPPDHSQERLASSIGLVTMARVTTMGINLVAGVVLARAMDLPERGAYAVMIAFSTISATCLTAGLETAALRVAGGGGAATAVRAALSRMGFACLLVLLVVPVPLLVSNNHQVLGLSLGEIAVSLAALPLIVGCQVFGACLLGTGRLGHWALATVLNAAVYAGSTWTVTLAGLTDLRVLFACLLLGYLVGISLMAWHIRDLWGPRDADMTAELRHTSRRSVGVTLAQLAMLRVQIPLLQILSTAGAVGVFAVATPLVETLLLIPVAAGTVLLPRYRAHGTDRETTRRHAMQIGLITLCCATALCISAPILVPALYGQRYAEASMLVLWMAPGLVVFAAARVLQSRLVAEGHFTPVIASGLAGLVSSAVLQLLLTPSWGASGAAFAISGGCLIASVLLWSGADRLADSRT